MGYCRRLKSKGSITSVGMSWIRGNSTTSPLYGPQEILASMTLLWSLLTTHLVLLVVLGRSSDRRTMVGVPTFNASSCGGMPGSSRELSRSIEHWTASSSLIAVSIDLKTRTSPGNYDIKLLLRRLAFLLSGDRIALSASHVMFSQPCAMLWKTASLSCSKLATERPNVAGMFTMSGNSVTAMFPLPIFGRRLDKVTE